MNHTYKILKYLYKNNDGSYHDIKKAYYKKKLPSDELLAKKIMELATAQLIDSRSVYEDRGLLEADEDTQVITLVVNRPKSYQVMITSLGEDYIDDRTYNLFGIWLLQKRNGILILIGIVTAIVNLIIRILL